jgi:hypothetical protein
MGGGGAVAPPAPHILCHCNFKAHFEVRVQFVHELIRVSATGQTLQFHDT